MLLFSSIGLRNMNKLSYVCAPSGRTEKFYPSYMMVLMFSLFYACILTMIMIAQQTFNMAKSTMNDPNCLTFKLVRHFRTFHIQRESQANSDTSHETQAVLPEERFEESASEDD